VRTRRRGERGQALLVGVAMTVALLAICSLALDVGMNYVDRRDLQTAADQGALAGASRLQSGSSYALTAAQQYAWANLHLSPASTSCSASPCTITYGSFPQTGSYQVTVTSPYTTISSAYSPSLVVAVDIIHVNPRVGFEGLLGYGSVTERSHAAAIVHAGVAKFPFAIATRFLDLNGTGTTTAYGAVLVGQCSDGGKGDFTDHNMNGGIYMNGQANLVIGRAKQSASTGDYDSAQAVLLADPSSRSSCAAQSNANASAGWTTLQDKVSFTAADSNYNYYYGFNSGPAGCQTSDASVDACTGSPTGVGSDWEDLSPICWRQGNNSIVPINSTTTTYTSGAIPLPTPVTACSSGATDSYEGSFVDGNFPTFPLYSNPIEVLSSLGVSVPTSGTGTLSGSGIISANQYFTRYSAGSGAQLLFQPGYYVFDGSAASLVLANTSSLSCESPTLAGNSSAVAGCVFIFRNGAALDVSTATASVNCSANNPLYGNCSFYFSDTGNSSSYLNFSQGVSVAAHPVQYTLRNATTPSRFPLVYSNSSNACWSPGTNVRCSVSMKQPGTFDIGGTIYVPNGITDISANGSSASGQVIGDTLRLQTGAAATATGVAYKGDEVAPVLGPASLIE
jgi:hypothetical protein